MGIMAHSADPDDMSHKAAFHQGLHPTKIINMITYYLGPSINGLVTDGNTKICCPGLVLAGFFQSTTAYQIDSEHTQDYTKLFSVCKVEILQVTVNKIQLCRLISDDFRLKVPKIAKKGTLVSC